MLTVSFAFLVATILFFCFERTRWMGVVGLVFGGLVILAGSSPQQYLAGMLAPLWLLVTSIGFVAGDRDSALRVVRDRLEQRPAIAPLRHADLHLRASQHRQPLLVHGIGDTNKKRRSRV